jgi:nitrate reductase delta subunit
MEPRLFRCFADLLDYPGTGLLETARACEAASAECAPEAAALVAEFRDLVQAMPLGRVQEIYSATFDLDATYHPYVGYHLFGETYKRSLFMLELRERLQACGFVVTAELPDHLGVLLRFLAHHPESALAGELVHEALLPALDRMMGKARSAGYEEEDSPAPPDSGRQRSPYRRVLEALRLVLQRVPARAAGAAAES